MQWTDDGLVLGLRRQGETSVILELMTRAHGRHLGLVHGGRSRRMQPVLQPGNRVQATWRARLDESLDRLRRRGGRPEGADDLGSTHLSTLPAEGVGNQTASGRSVGGIGAGSVVPPVSCLSTQAAAARPSEIAHTISDWPRPASPAT